jgi:hypothetical protein
MRKFFMMQYADEEANAPYGVAYKKEKKLFLLPPSGERVNSWNSECLTLQSGEFADYLANNAGLRLCSDKLREIIENCRGGKDALQWLETTVSDLMGARRKYFALHFPEDYDVLDRKRSILAGGGKMIVKGVLSRAGVDGHRVFSYPRESGRRCLVDDLVRQTIENAGCTGMGFSEVSVSD